MMKYLQSVGIGVLVAALIVVAVGLMGTTPADRPLEMQPVLRTRTVPPDIDLEVLQAEDLEDILQSREVYRVVRDGLVQRHQLKEDVAAGIYTMLQRHHDLVLQDSGLRYPVSFSEFETATAHFARVIVVLGKQKTGGDRNRIIRAGLREYRRRYVN